MAGHSKWAQIKRSKAVKDQKKGKLYAQMAREIMVATKLGGADPDGNFRLRTAIDRAKAGGVPNDNIKRAIEKGSGAGGADNLEDVIYEGYGPGGVAVFIETMTDNRNRTAGDIRSYFNKYSGNLGSDGCVAWMFDLKGHVQVDKSSRSDETIFDMAVEAGASDLKQSDEDEIYDIFTEPEALNTVCEGLSKSGIEVVSAEMTRIPQNSVQVADPDHASQLMKLLDAIESHDDVQAVYANFEMDDALLDQLSSS